MSLHTHLSPSGFADSHMQPLWNNYKQSKVKCLFLFIFRHVQTEVLHLAQQLPHLQLHNQQKQACVLWSLSSKEAFGHAVTYELLQKPPTV